MGSGSSPVGFILTALIAAIIASSTCIFCNAISAVGTELGVRGQRQPARPVLEVEPGIVELGCDDAERIHPGRLELVAQAAQPGNAAPAERAVEPDEQRQEYRHACRGSRQATPSPLPALPAVRSREPARPAAPGACVGSIVSNRYYLLTFISIRNGSTTERVAVESGPLADVLGLLEIALRLGAIAAIELHRRDAVVAGEQKLRLADFLGDDQRFLIVAQRGAEFTMALMDLPSTMSGTAR